MIRSRLRPESKKHRTEREQRAEVVQQAHERDNWRCRFWDFADIDLLAQSSVPYECRGPLDPHEIIGRDLWRAGYLVLDNVISLCRRHHDHVTVNPEFGHEIGLVGHSWERPDYCGVCGAGPGSAHWAGCPGGAAT